MLCENSSRTVGLLRFAISELAICWRSNPTFDVAHATHRHGRMGVGVAAANACQGAINFLRQNFCAKCF